MVQDDKYVVFRRRDLDRMTADVIDLSLATPIEDAAVFRERMTAAILNLSLAAPIEDAVVIRRQDIFAPPALDAYANAILCAVEVMRDLSVPSLQIKRLETIADYFHEQAVAAWNTERKIPD